MRVSDVEIKIIIAIITRNANQQQTRRQLASVVRPSLADAASIHHRFSQSDILTLLNLQMNKYSKIKLTGILSGYLLLIFFDSAFLLSEKEMESCQTYSDLPCLLMQTKTRQGPRLVVHFYMIYQECKHMLTQRVLFFESPLHCRGVGVDLKDNAMLRIKRFAKCCSQFHYFFSVLLCRNSTSRMDYDAKLFLFSSNNAMRRAQAPTSQFNSFSRKENFKTNQQMRSCFDRQSPPAMELNLQIEPEHSRSFLACLCTTFILSLLQENPTMIKH